MAGSLRSRLTQQVERLLCHARYIFVRELALQRLSQYLAIYLQTSINLRSDLRKQIAAINLATTSDISTVRAQRAVGINEAM